MSILGEIAKTYQSVRTVFWRNLVEKIEFLEFPNELFVLINLPPQLANT